MAMLSPAGSGAALGVQHPGCLSSASAAGGWGVLSAELGYVAHLVHVMRIHSCV